MKTKPSIRTIMRRPVDLGGITLRVLGIAVGVAAMLAAPAAVDMLTQGATTLIASTNAAPGGGGGKPEEPTGSPPVDFGDLVMLYRDDRGVPILDANACQQPLAFPSETCLLDCTGQDPCLVPLDPLTCAVEAEFAGCTKEVEFGRINEARSPDSVFDSQLADVRVALATADCRTLDPAGRMVASTYDDDTQDNLAKTIDSPLQSLAIYRQLILTGDLGVDLPQDADVLTTAARGLGAASDKTGEVNVDLVAYLNQIMGLSDKGTPTILDPKICIFVREEVQGNVDPQVEKCFLDYQSYGYTRSTNFQGLPDPPYIADPNGDPDQPGWFEYLTKLSDSPPTYGIAYGPIIGAVFDNQNASGSDIGAFAQAADDARAVIDYMHVWQVPVGDETPVPCEPSGDILYDLGIPEMSGLQVPKNYVNGGEREFTVTVTNEGPDRGNGRVTVEAWKKFGDDPATEMLNSWLFTFTDLLPEQSRSFLKVFVLTTDSPMIEWKATVAADPPGEDRNEDNNVRTAISSIRVSGGGGGHQ